MNFSRKIERESEKENLKIRKRKKKKNRRGNEINIKPKRPDYPKLTLLPRDK